MQVGSWLACGRQVEGKQAFRSTRSRTASMKQYEMWQTDKRHRHSDRKASSWDC
jgi:hypothetical protein